MSSWLGRLFGAAAPLPLRAARWVVVDCETSGLDMARDRLLAVGAVAVHGGRIELAESFGGILRQDLPSDAHNILVHGIGADAQKNGRPAEEVLPEFARFLGDGIPVAFHAPFDDAVLRRAMSGVRGLAAPRRWLDLAQLAPVLFPGRTEPAERSLDDWLKAFGIEHAERHDALGDAFATAQLLLVLLAEAERQGSRSVEDLQRAARSGRWLAAG